MEQGVHTYIALLACGEGYCKKLLLFDPFETLLTIYVS